MDENKNIELIAEDTNEEIIDIEIDEAFPYVPENGAMLNHSFMYGRELSNQHPIAAITGLEEKLNDISSVKQVYSTQSGLSEFRKWDDNNPNSEDRSGYFVSIVEGTENVTISSVTSDVYGVSVTRASAGFVGGQNEYDKSDDFSYAVVGIVGAVRVRTDGTAKVGEYVIPNAYGEATFSESESGYKVLSQGSYSAYNYVTIAFVPQVGVIGGGGAGGGTGSGDLDEIIVQIEQLDNKTKDTYQIAIDTSNMTKEEIAAIKTEISTMGTRVTSTEEAIAEVTDVANEASQKAENAVQSANELKQEAVDAAEGAITEAREASTLASNLASQMEPLVSWPEGSEDPSGVAGFVAQANADHVTLASLVGGSGESGTDLSAIIQRVDENGAIIQHLVSHVDRYSVGSKSISDGLTYEEAKSLLTDTHIYVCTLGHVEIMEGAEPEQIEFQREDGATRIYTWNPEAYKWESGAIVDTTPVYKDGSSVGDLWLCFEDVERKDENDNVIETYVAGTLYRWFGSNWVAVATIEGSNEGRILTSVAQTANEIKMVVNNYGNEGSTFQQNLDGILTTVQDSDNYISAIEQTAASIRVGTYSPTDTGSNLEMLAADTSAGLSAVSYGRFHILYQSFLGTKDVYDDPDNPDDGKRYSKPPTWDESKGIFVFSQSDEDVNGDYYFYSEDKTRYCVVTKDGYDIYMIGNKVTSLIDSRISETEAILTMGVEHMSEDDEGKYTTLADIIAKANANEARIDSITSYSHDTLLTILDTEVPIYGDRRYNAPPEWDASSGEYKFNIENRDENGIYYLADDQGSTYCKVVTTGDGQTLYEIYGLVGHYMSSITQGANEDGGYIQSIVMDIERYNVGQYSQSYGMSYDDAITAIPEGTMYVPTVAHSENLMRDAIDSVSIDDGTEVLSAGTLEEREAGNDVVRLTTPPLEAFEVTEMQTYDFEVDETDGVPTQTYRYMWTGTGWEKGTSVSMSNKYFEYDETDNPFDLWYCIEDVTHTTSDGTEEIYRAGTLYAWKGGRWFAIATTHDSLLSRSISLVRQTADSYSVEIRGLKGDFSEYKQTTDYISQTVGGSDGSIGNLTITKEGIAGEVYNRTGNSATLKAQADSTQAVMDLMISGVYHKLEQPLSSSVPEPYGEWEKYSVRPEWSASLGRFVFYTDYEDEDGIYYFFDEDETHYCKVVGDQYEVYTIGTLSTAGTDAHITEEYATINTLATYGDDETSTIAGLRTLALESKAQVELLASLDRNKLHSVVNIAGYKPEGARYSEKPTYKNGAFVFDSTKQDDGGLYFLIGAGSQFGKLIYSNSGICTGYEVYEYDNSNTAGLISTVLDNKASVGLLVTDGAANGKLIIDAINGESTAVISADRISIEGVITATNLSTAGETVINGSNVTTGTIKSSDYSYSSGNFSTDGTAFNLTNGSITSKNFAIDTNGNLYLKGDITASNAKIKGGLSVGSSDGSTYNFVVDSYGNVSVAGTLDAKVLKFNGKSVLTSEDKIDADYLELEAIKIVAPDGTAIFSANGNGVKINANVTMGSTSSISWSDITGKPTNLATTADVDSAYDLAQDAYNRSTTVYSTVNDWSYTYNGKTYIDGTKLMTGTVIASSLMSGTVALLDADGYARGNIYLRDADSSDYAVEYESEGATAIRSAFGAVYLEGGQASSYNRTKLLITYDDTYGRLISCTGDVLPSTGDSYILGHQNKAWLDIYSMNEVTTLSDRREKQNIEYNIDKYSDFFFDLKPTQYKFINNNSNRYHIGFISQDIEESLAKYGLESTDFAGFVKSPVYEEDKSTIKDYKYNLRYGEFIALNTHMIQKLYKRVEELETKLAQTEE